MPQTWEYMTLLLVEGGSTTDLEEDPQLVGQPRLGGSRYGSATDGTGWK